MTNARDRGAGSGAREIGRRAFLGRLAAAGGAVAAATAFPWIWAPRRSFAMAGPLHGVADHLLILNADGGLRSPVLFNADLALRWNPHRAADGSPTQPGAPGTAWGVGAIFDASAIAIPSLGAGVTMPPLPAISNEITVLGTVDHLPDEARSDGSHLTARHRIATGTHEGRTGLLTHIYKHHPAFQGSGAEQAFPPVVIGSPARLFGAAEPADGARRPLYFNGPEDFRSGAAARPHIPQRPWAQRVTERLDTRLAERLAPRDRAVLDAYVAAKRDMTRFRTILRDPMIDVAASDFEDAALGSNALLREAFGQGAWGGRVALAVRMLQLGSPAVVVGVTGHDTHSNEIVDLPPLARDLGRQLAALRFVLGRLPHPRGGSYLDRTLITVASEFSRDNTEPQTGYNSANGSDHRGDDGSRHQALPLMGAGVGAGALLGEVDALTMAPLDRDVVFSSQSFLATLLDAIGVDTSAFWQDAPIAGLGA